MTSFPNIEKSAFGPGEFVGYAGGVWLITRSDSSFGNWIARFRDKTTVPNIYAFGLAAMSRKLTDFALTDYDRERSDRNRCYAYPSPRPLN